MKTHGDPGWQSFPSYLDIVLPRVLRLLEKHDLKITFFIVGQDAALEKNKNALSLIPQAGHEIGNHSFHHEPWLHLYKDKEIEHEIEAAEDAIVSATGVRPKGFRGPGFSLSKSVLETLKKRGYQYDASTFPTFLGPLARAYYFFNSKLSDDDKDKRKILFGKFSEGFRSVKPYKWELDKGTLAELPVTTMPIFKVPFHLSYLIYLSCYSRTLAKGYLNWSIAMCKINGVEPSFLLHPLDFLGKDDVSCLSFFPGMNLTADAKLSIVEDVFKIFKKHYKVLPMGEHLKTLHAHNKLPIKEAVF